MGYLTLANQIKKTDPMAAGAKTVGMAQQSIPQFSQTDMDSLAQAGQAQGQQAAQRMADSLPMPSSQSEYSQPPIPEEYERERQSLFRPGPLQQRYSAAALAGPGEAPHGFLGHLKGAGMGFLLGGLPGAVAGSISPGIPQRAIFRGVTLPQLAQQADQEMQQQGQQRQGYHALAQSTGYDPITHQPTLPMLTQQNMMQHRNILENQGQQRIGIQQQRADTGDARLDWQRQFGEQRLAQHQQGLDNGSHQLVKGMTASGHVGWFSVNKADPSDVVQVADSDGKPLETPDAMLEGGRNARFAAGQVGINSRFQQSQQGTESRFQRSQSGQESRFQRSQEGMDRRAKSKRVGGLLEAARQQMGQGEQPAAPTQTAPQSSPVTRPIYDAMVKEKGQARTDAYMRSKGWPIPQ